MTDQFVHLHNHTDHSILDGASRIPDMLTAAHHAGQPAIAVTDHGAMTGTYDLWKQAAKVGIKPIAGVEAYLAPGQRTDRSPHQTLGAYTHITLLAETAEGLRNLFRLTSLASLEGFFHKPRLDRELLAKYSTGIIATTGCMGGEVQQWLKAGRPDQALACAGELRDIFGPANYFLEVMDHGIAEEHRLRDGLLRVGEQLDLTALATNDCHYTPADHAATHDVLLCVQTGAKLSDVKRFRFEGDGYHLKTAAEMRSYWDRELPGACDATLTVADRVGSYDEVFAARNLMARVEVPAGHTESSRLRETATAALAARGLDGRDGYRARLDFELAIIDEKGYPGYFLVVADICREMAARRIRFNTRGSAAGSLVAYALGVTNVDPIPYSILFERFLNPERPSAPDIDLDIDESRRTEMIEYVTGKYGADRVAQIVTFGIIKSRAAVKDAARVLGHPYSLGEQIVKALPPMSMGKDVPLSKILAGDPRPESKAVRDLYAADPAVRAVIDVAAGLEGIKRQVGVHAAGVILSSEPLLDVLPIWRRPADGVIVAGFDMNECDALGLVKMDFLGLRNLTVLDAAIGNIKRNHGVDIDLAALPLTDKATYDALSAGDTLGVFQLDGPGISGLLRLMRPTQFEDISATLALYRPGPMGVGAHTDYARRKNGTQQVQPIHPELAEPLADILDETYGLIVYQEQVMSIVQRVAGYTLGRADILRRAMGKKKKEVLDAEFAGFEAGMRANGFSDAAITALWNTLIPFSDYAFNKAHTASYGMMSYWTAYLKTNYPTEYMAALLTSVGGDKDQAAVYLAECRRLGIRVLLPDVNESRREFAAVDDVIRFGLGAVRNVGGAVVEAIVRCRAEKGAYTDFYDFLRKADAVVCNKKPVESLIKAGAFDSLGQPRRGLMAVHADAVDRHLGVKRSEAAGQFDLFADLGVDDAAAATDEPVPAGEWDVATLLAFEREMLGLYVSAHPLDRVARALRGHASHTAAQVRAGDLPDGTSVTLAGLLTGVSRRVTKAGKQWASAVVEDLDGQVEVLFFPATFEQVDELLADDALVVVEGRVNIRDDKAPAVTAFAAKLLEAAAVDEGQPLAISMRPDAVTPEKVARLREVVDRHRGGTELRVALTRPDGSATLLRLDTPVAVSPALLADLKALVGARNVGLS